MGKETGIYLIRNKVNGKFYLGSALNITKRWEAHKRNLVQGNHHCVHLQRAWNKYGAYNFEFVIWESVCSEELLSLEQACLDFFRPWDRAIGYNIAMYVSSPMRGLKQSQESNQKRSLALSGSNHPNYGKKLTFFQTPEIFKLKSERMTGDKNPMAGRNGDKNPKTVLKKEMIPKIRESYLNGSTITSLAKEYGVAWMTIKYVVTYETWKHIT